MKKTPVVSHCQQARLYCPACGRDYYVMWDTEVMDYPLACPVCAAVLNIPDDQAAETGER